MAPIVADAGVSQLSFRGTLALLQLERHCLPVVPNISTLQNGEEYGLYWFSVKPEGSKTLDALSESGPITGS